MVFGGGPIGCLIALVCRHRGARVAVVEINPFRVEMLRRLGLEVVGPGVDPVRFANEWTYGDGVDVAFEVTGHPGPVKAITEVVRVWGTISIVAIHSEPMPVNLHRFFARELNLHGSRLYTRAAWEEAIRLGASGAVPPRTARQSRDSARVPPGGHGDRAGRRACHEGARGRDGLTGRSAGPHDPGSRRSASPLGSPPHVTPGGPPGRCRCMRDSVARALPDSSGSRGALWNLSWHLRRAREISSIRARAHRRRASRSRGAVESGPAALATFAKGSAKASAAAATPRTTSRRAQPSVPMLSSRPRSPSGRPPRPFRRTPSTRRCSPRVATPAIAALDQRFATSATLRLFSDTSSEQRPCRLIGYDAEPSGAPIENFPVACRVLPFENGPGARAVGNDSAHAAAEGGVMPLISTSTRRSRA